MLIFFLKKKQNMDYLMKRVIYFACLPEGHHRIVMWCCWPWHGQHGASHVIICAYI